MSLENDRLEEDEMRPEYDLRGGVRGKYYSQYMQGANIVLLDSGVAAVFPGSESVNLNGLRLNPLDAPATPPALPTPL